MHHKNRSMIVIGILRINSKANCNRLHVEKGLGTNPQEAMTCREHLMIWEPKMFSYVKGNS